MNKIIHLKIRELRLKQKKTITFMADKLYMTPAGYSLKEAGKRKITTDELEKIASALDVTPKYFYEE
ncbi:helix-turn-helix domain-containing protein [Calidifontibacillus erzurumensis]|uniref:helix-turn-helix domain-containing protein n=1 Tax=Calidifontibacillus erzurumensis TaxID=2741433 RepID=UPI0035B53B69